MWTHRFRDWSPKKTVINWSDLHPLQMPSRSRLKKKPTDLSMTSWTPHSRPSWISPENNKRKLDFSASKKKKQPLQFDYKKKKKQTLENETGTQHKKWIVDCFNCVGPFFSKKTLIDSPIWGEVGNWQNGRVRTKTDGIKFSLFFLFFFVIIIRLTWETLCHWLAFNCYDGR